MVNSRNLAINSFISRKYSSTAGAIVSDWNGFVEKIGKIYENCRKYSDGEVASYIPQLKNVDTERYALSVRTIDGKSANWGDTKFKYCLQSVSKPFTYSMAIDERGDNYVHKYVGQEPSGRNFNDICLDKLGRPHNPMINAGAIVVTSMLKPELKSWDRFDYILKQIRRFAGNNELTFDNTTYVSEKETGHQNYAIAHFLKQNNCYPNNESIDLKDVLELYFQHCSIQTNTETMAIMAATLANGGIDPLNNERVVSEKAVQHTLSLMFSCGMYDYSGQMAFKVGLPAKSGVSGNMIIVVPNLMGIALYSPKLDQWGNTVRGVKFSEELVSTFHLHLMAAGNRCAVCNSKKLI